MENIIIYVHEHIRTHSNYWNKYLQFLLWIAPFDVLACPPPKAVNPCLCLKFYKLQTLYKSFVTVHMWIGMAHFEGKKTHENSTCMQLTICTQQCGWQTWLFLPLLMCIDKHRANLIIPYKSNMAMSWKDWREDTSTYIFSASSTHIHYRCHNDANVRMDFTKRSYYEMCRHAVSG